MTRIMLPVFSKPNSRNIPWDIASKFALRLTASCNNSTIPTASPRSSPPSSYMLPPPRNQLSSKLSDVGAHAIESEGVEGVRFAVWAPNAEVVAALPAISTAGIPRVIRCACAMAASGRFSFPAWRRGPIYKSRFAHEMAVSSSSPILMGSSEVPPKTASTVWRSQITNGRMAMDGRSGRT